MEREREETRAEDARAAAILAAEAAEAELIGIEDDETAIDLAEADMLAHLRDLDIHLNLNEGESNEQDIGMLNVLHYSSNVIYIEFLDKLN